MRRAADREFPKVACSLGNFLSTPAKVEGKVVTGEVGACGL